MKSYLSIFLWGGFLINIQSQNDITITLVNEDTMNIDSLFVTIRYQNNTNDTIHFLDYLDCYEVQNIDFFSEDKAIICCGTKCHISFSDEISKYPCRGKSFDVEILPHKFLEKRFHLKRDLNYSGFIRGHCYRYRVELHVSDQFKTYCSNIWTGISCSNYGFFKIRN